MSRNSSWQPVWSSGAKPISSMMIRSLRQTVLDGSADGVVGDGAVEVLDELDGGEVADLVSGFDGGAAEPDEVVGLAGAGGADEAEVVGSADPVEGDEVVVAGLRDRGLGEVELVERLVDREPGRGHPVRAVRLVTGAISRSTSTRRVSSGVQRCVLRGEQHLGCLAADRRQLQPFQAGFEIGGQRGGGGARAHARFSIR